MEIANPEDRPSGIVTPSLAPETPRLSVVMSTYNRGALLKDAIGSVLAQRDRTPAFELIVVDNNSTDGTAGIVTPMAAADTRVRYVFEPRQGLSYARNTGIAHARAPVIAFTDDDVRVDTDWVTAIVRGFDEHPAADFLGGRVLPMWPASPPAWLTRDHWAPLALVDHGDHPVTISAERPICVLGANVAFRRRAFETVGGFGADFQRVKDGIGSLEDHEFQLRLLRSGSGGVYDPRIVVHAEVQPNRLDRAYHRRWHAGHGHFHALLRSEEMERTRAGTLFGVPLHLYRQALADAAGWIATKTMRQSSRAFQHELRLRFFKGFLQTRRREFLRRPRHEQREELRRLIRRGAPPLEALRPASEMRVGEHHR